MHRLPNPTLTFTIPSIHDGTILNCRIYHPLNSASSLTSSQWNHKHAAIIAHPYAPLGGSYDDPIIEQVAIQLLQRKFVVGTFNFRGAAHSSGRTSWTSRAERTDYITFVGFMLHYIHHLKPPSCPPTPPTPPTPSPILLMAGYSYGAMVTSHLPDLKSINQLFSSVPESSPHAHVIHLAEALATRESNLLSLAAPTSLRVGEAESPSAVKTHDSRTASGSPSTDDDSERRLKRGINHLVARTRRLSLHSRQQCELPPMSGLSPSLQDAKLADEDLVLPRAGYLLISPLQGMATHLATMSRAPQTEEAEAKMERHETLAVYGDGDIFVSTEKLRSWVARMEVIDGSLFKGHEVQGAGHFWVEQGVLGMLMGIIGRFVDGLVG